MNRCVAVAVVLFTLLESAGQAADYPCRWVYVWSDMLDPKHNAHGNYYLVEGHYTGSWNCTASHPWKSSMPVVGSVMVPYSF